jgi:hypothetical protein
VRDRVVDHAKRRVGDGAPHVGGDIGAPDLRQVQEPEQADEAEGPGDRRDQHAKGDAIGGDEQMVLAERLDHAGREPLEHGLPMPDPARR